MSNSKASFNKVLVVLLIAPFAFDVPQVDAGIGSGGQYIYAVVKPH
jgi:hypothetical protein